MNSKKDAGTILVVDDTPTNIKLMLDHLSSCGFKVLIAHDGRSAIEQAKLARPDLVLLDVLMPGMDAFETCQKLKGNDETQDYPGCFSHGHFRKCQQGAGIRSRRRRLHH